MKEMYRGIAFSPTTELTQAITATSTTIYVSNPNVFPDAPNYATISTDDTAEVILYTGKTSTSLTGCTRGVEGTAKAWGIGQIIARNYTNKDHDNFIDNIKELFDTTTNVANLNLTNGSGKYSLKSITEENNNNSVTGAYSFALGEKHSIASESSFSIGSKNTITTSAKYSYAGGHANLNEGSYSYTEGYGNKALNGVTHAEGQMTIASGAVAHAQNFHTIANMSYSTAIGKYNKEMSQGDLFIIGNGIDEENRTNALRVDSNGNTYGLSAFQSTGADYAEYYEWFDQNPNNEDRVGLFVTFAEGSKIRIANANDNYILGVVSGNPSVVGNSYNDHWQGIYLKDYFDRIIYEEIDGEMQPKINPEYDPTKSFIGRAKRPEWATIGTHGQLSVYDDGSCQVDGYCKAGDNGVSTSAKKGVNTYRVIGRLTDNIIKIQIK